jgi:hypothetical protein
MDRDEKMTPLKSSDRGQPLRLMLVIENHTSELDMDENMYIRGHYVYSIMTFVEHSEYPYIENGKIRSAETRAKIEQAVRDMWSWIAKNKKTTDDIDDFQNVNEDGGLDDSLAVPLDQTHLEFWHKVLVFNKRTFPPNQTAMRILGNYHPIATDAIVIRSKLVAAKDYVPVRPRRV